MTPKSRRWSRTVMQINEFTSGITKPLHATVHPQIHLHISCNFLEKKSRAATFWSRRPGGDPRLFPVAVVVAHAADLEASGKLAVNYVQDRSFWQQKYPNRQVEHAMFIMQIAMVTLWLYR